MIPVDLRPQLAAKARLHFDRHTSTYMLVYPERGMTLNGTAAAVVQLCDGARSMNEIVCELQQQFSATPAEQIEREVFAFMHVLIYRGLIKGEE